MVRTIALCVALVATLGACQGDAPIPELTQSEARHEPRATYEFSDPAHTKTAKKAFKILRERCALGSVFEDLVSIQVTLEELGQSHYLTQRYGWRRVVRVEPEFREDIRGRRWDPREVAGHRFDFRLGGWNAPGISADKWIGHELCGMDVPRSETGYIAVPALSILDAIDVPDAATATRETPKSVDFKKLFRSTPSEIRELWGHPVKDRYGEEQYVFPDMRISVRYQDGRAARAELSGTSLSKVRALARKAGRFKVEEIDGIVYVMDPRLPATGPDVMSFLGVSAKEARSALGRTSGNEGTWERDGYIIVIVDEGVDVVAEVAITFDGPVIPKKRQSELRKWAKIPAGSTITANGKRYTVAFDEMSVLFKAK